MEKSLYLKKVIECLPRVLGLIDNDVTNKSYGTADRFYWAWGLTDFGNGTFQGMANGLSSLWKEKLWPYETDSQIFINRINSLFVGTKFLTKNNGSLEEAFPNEGSYCVTALVAYDLLCAIDNLKDEIDNKTLESWIKIVDPLVKFLIKFNETHALISNHLATAVAALVRWNKLVGSEDANNKAKTLLDIILNNQSSEGWYKEYESADPGYQSLCTNYLADVYLNRPSKILLESLKKSVKFLSYFVHPDGSFGGVYGSRCTRFYYPGGLEFLSKEIPDALLISKEMHSSIEFNKVIPLNAMDESNLIPMFNSYCMAAKFYRNSTLKKHDKLPYQKPFGIKFFEKSGLFLDCGNTHYTIVNIFKGGVILHFKKNKLLICNSGIIVQNQKEKFGSTHVYSEQIKFNFIDNKKIEIIAPLYLMPKKLPSVIDFILLRIMSLTIFNITIIKEWIKSFLVHFLITKKSKLNLNNKRIIDLGSDLTFSDSLSNNRKFKIRKDINYFIPIHMASQGYWQIQDEQKI